MLISVRNEEYWNMHWPRLSPISLHESSLIQLVKAKCSADLLPMMILYSSFSIMKFQFATNCSRQEGRESARKVLEKRHATPKLGNMPVSGAHLF
jgi:hypothetical protein